MTKVRRLKIEILVSMTLFFSLAYFFVIRTVSMELRDQWTNPILMACFVSLVWGIVAKIRLWLLQD